MNSKHLLREQLFEIVTNQIRNNDPPETKLTYDRLLGSDYTDLQCKQLIAKCISVELFDVMKKGKSFDLDRYIKNLKQLPKEPIDISL